MRRLLIVGPAPGRALQRGAFDAPSGRRLAGLLGQPYPPGGLVTVPGFLEAENLVEEWPGEASSGGDRKPSPRALRAGAARLRERYAGAWTVVGCGRETALALAQMTAVAARPWRADYLSAVWSGDWLLACLPHPSGRNRWYNDEANARAAAGFLRALAP